MPSCRTCHGHNLQCFLSLGRQPLANSFLSKEALAKPEPFYPLDVYFCSDCGLVQLVDVVSPEVLFRDYVYASSSSNTRRQHHARLAQEVFERFLAGKDSLVVDIGSNDGCLLQGFRPLGVRTLGVEPATNIARLAEAAGIETVNDFFSPALAQRLKEAKGGAHAITLTNVFAHIDDLDSLLTGVRTLLAERGVLVIEAPYLDDLLEGMLWDTIYHEHLSYFSVGPLIPLFRRFGMELFDVERTPIDGGAIRIFAGRAGESPPPTQRVGEMLALEKAKGLSSLATFQRFAARVQRSKEELRSLLGRLKAEGRRLAGYGAPAKGNTMLNYCQIGPETLDYIVDGAPLKQGLFTPGTHIPVVPPARMREERPDYMLLLAWNFKDEIMGRERWFQESGGKFIMPVPQVEVVA
ncbi:MAG: class I SAM-dependent methyltransferase [Chloroflexota bacterium]|nr:class I SAM-dependent methyltransferase [Chloroflexota bacterium]